MTSSFSTSGILASVLTTLNSQHSQVKGDDLEKMGEKFKESLKKGELSGEVISNTYLFQFTQKSESVSRTSFVSQGSMGDFKKLQELMESVNEELMGYKGKELSRLTPKEAKELVSDGGFFSLENTASRLSSFVVSGAKGSVDMLKAGREGVMMGFHQAEALWGEKLPELSYKTLESALTSIDHVIAKEGGSVLNVEG